MHHKKISLEETYVAESYYFAGTSTITVGNYDFIVNTFYPEHSNETATNRLCAEVAPQIIRTLAKQKQKVLPSSRKCHAATGAGRR